MKIFKKSALVLAMTASAGMANAAGFIDIQDLGGWADTVGTAQTPTNDNDLVGDVATNGAADETGAIGFEVLLDQANLATRTVNIGTEAGLTGARALVYVPNTGIGENSTITFEVVNGTISANDTPTLVDAAGDPDVVGTLVDFTADSDGNYETLRFQVEAGGLSAGAQYALANGDPDTTADVGGADAPTFIADSGLSAGQSVTIAATSAQDPSAIAISQGTAPAENVITSVAGLKATVNAETSTIDVEAATSRSLFVEDDSSATNDGSNDIVAGDVETFTDESQSNFTLTRGDAEITFALANADYDVTLTRDSTSGVDDVQLDINDVGDSALTEANGVYSISGTDAADDLLAGLNDLSINVNGTDVLATGNWLLSLVLDTAEAGEVQVLDEAVSHTWDINGAQVKIPYHAQNASGFVFFFNAVNESDNDATVFADVIVENKTQGTRFSKTNVDLGTAVANGSSTIGQAAIASAINADDEAGTINESDVYHVAMTLTVLAPQNSIQVAAFQKDAVGRTVVPVYINTTNEYDGRKWQQ